MRAKSGGLLATVFAISALLLVIGGIALFWIAFRGVKMLESGAAHAATVVTGDAAAMAGHADYVGTWEGGGETLTIDAGGRCSYSMVSAHESEKINGSVSFAGANVVIDFLVSKKRMHVDAAPHVDGARTVMTLDGVELEKK